MIKTISYMDLSDIYVHDGRLLRVIEDTQSDTLKMEVELPKDKVSDDLIPRLLLFENAHNYQVFEGPFQGSPTILDMKVIGQKDRWWLVRLDTNAGYRDVYCTAVKVTGA